MNDRISARDWPEDFPHENGHYECACVRCGGHFVGHKRRVVCRECAANEDPCCAWMAKPWNAGKPHLLHTPTEGQDLSGVIWLWPFRRRSPSATVTPGAPPTRLPPALPTPTEGRDATAFEGLQRREPEDPARWLAVALACATVLLMLAFVSCGPAPAERPIDSLNPARPSRALRALAVAATCPEGTVARSVGGECWCVDRVTLRPVQRCSSAPVPTPTSAPPTPVPTVAPVPTPTAAPGPTPTPAPPANGVFTWLSGSMAIQDVPGRFAEAPDGTLLLDGRIAYVPRFDSAGNQTARYALRRIP